MFWTYTYYCRSRELSSPVVVENWIIQAKIDLKPPCFLSNIQVVPAEPQTHLFEQGKMYVYTYIYIHYYIIYIHIHIEELRVDRRKSGILGGYVSNMVKLCDGP